MPEQLDANELREVAKLIEETALEALTAYLEISFAPVVGNLQYFPRPTSEQQSAEQGFGVLREDVEEVVAILYALAAARERELSVPLAFQVRVQPYIEAFRAPRWQPAENDKAQAQEAQRPSEV